MSDTTLDLPPLTTDCAFWLGWMGGAIAETLYQLERVDDKTGEPLYEKAETVRLLKHSLEHYAASEVARQIVADGIADRVLAGFVVESADGEAQALRDTWAEAKAAIKDVESYYHGAETCGHPGAPGWVARKRPWKVRQITRAERDEILEDNAAVIDREP